MQEVLDSAWAEKGQGQNKRKELVYLVSWKGYNDDTWEPEANLANAQELVEEFYGKGGPPPLSPRSLQSFAARQAELEEYSISASGDMDSKTFDEWPRISVASRVQTLAKTSKKAHAKKRRAASLGNVILPSEIEREGLSTNTRPLDYNDKVAQKVCAPVAFYWL